MVEERGNRPDNQNTVLGEAMYSNVMVPKIRPGGGLYFNAARFVVLLLLFSSWRITFLEENYSHL